MVRHKEKLGPTSSRSEREGDVGVGLARPEVMGNCESDFYYTILFAILRTLCA